MPGLDRLQCVEDARDVARQRMPWTIFDFVDGAAGAGIAKRLNTRSLDRIRLQPRVLINVEQRRLGCGFLDRAWRLPFGIAPMGMCAVAWPGADRYLTAAAVRHDIPLCISTAASISLEDARRLAGEHAWFQLYVGQSHEAAFDLVRRAEAAGYEHLIFTVDTPEISRRPRELRRGFKVPFKLGPKQVFDFALHPRWSLSTLLNGIPRIANFEDRTGEPTERGAGGSFNRSQSRGSADWTFLDRLRERWPARLIVKGVLSPDDASRIKNAGADAIYVSNHGGRQLDGAPPAIGMLPAIRQAVGESYPLIFDSGVRCGEGIVKALALGADFVMLGRPFLYALGAAGEPGLARIIDVLAEETDLTLAQIGCPDVENINSSVIAADVATAYPVPADFGGKRPEDGPGLAAISAEQPTPGEPAPREPTPREPTQRRMG
ncbi:MAG: alpha-hydroxy acid oxidase [Gammaproteobacteria bacterium]